MSNIDKTQHRCYNITYGHTKNGRRSIFSSLKGGVAMGVMEVLTLGLLICAVIQLVQNSNTKK